MLGPQGNFFFLLLLLTFAGLVAWVVITRRVFLRVLAACLSFLPAMVFGIGVVNKYYDYYQTWGALFSDLSGQAPSVPLLSSATLGSGNAAAVQALIKSSDAQLDAKFGLLFDTTIAGRGSHISRQAYVYLPPQYFSKAYASYRFPAIELLHGSPGQPSAWVNVMNVIPVFLQLLNAHEAQPAVLVMPDTDGGQQYALQCLNDPHGLQDMTYVGREVAAWTAASLRVQPPGPAWGIAGYSEGGYCAANIGLQYPARFGFTGVLSGYFAPIASQVPVDGKPRDIQVYRHYPRLELVNSPDEYITRIPSRVIIPHFFLAAGAEDLGDVRDAEVFRQELELRNASVPLVIIPGGGHQARVWRAALTPMFEWMTPQLSEAVKLAEQKAAAQRRKHRHAVTA